MSVLPITLKESLRRSVRVERTRHADAQCEVVKRYHGHGFMARVLDRRRARREYALLAGLWRDGFPVPRPIAMRESARGAELSMEWIERAVTLSDVMHGRAPWPCTEAAAARALGALLARAHALGLDHPDLHSGNVLLDASGKGAWLVDLQAARRVARLGSKAQLRDLITVAADTRELLSERFRSRFWVSYWKSIDAAHRLRSSGPAQGGAGAAPIAPRTELARTIEIAARAHRRQVVERSRRRWTRRSSVCAPLEIAGVRGFRALAIDAAALEVCLSAASQARAAAGDERPCLSLRDGARELVEIRARDARDTLACWYGAARLSEHNLACAKPLVLTQSPHNWAGFAVPHGARSYRMALPSLAVPERRNALVSLGELLGGFDDRGFAIASLARDAVWLTPDGRALFAPQVGLTLREALAAERFDPRSPRDPRPFLQALGIESSEERSVCLSAFVEAERSGRDRRAHIRECLGG